MLTVIRVLLITPFTPLRAHDHAANDLAANLVRALGKLVELHVYAPGQDFVGKGACVIDGVTYHEGSEIHYSPIQRFGGYPYSFRGSWSARSTQEVKSLVENLRPDIVHGEYVQTTEALLHSPVPWSVTLHDMPQKTHAQAISGARGFQRLYQYVEILRINRVERLVISLAPCIFALSERDASELRLAARSVISARIGVDIPATLWSQKHDATIPTLLFAGAMWRTPNQISARYLAENVLPLVQEAFPRTVLRIVGARPSNEVKKLAKIPGVVVVGSVDEFDEEFATASVVLTPSMVDAGVLLKALRAMACGSPVVMNSRAATPLLGLENNFHALVRDDPKSTAIGIISLLADEELACALGRHAAEYVAASYTWEGCAHTYLKGFEGLLQRATSHD